MSQHIVCQIPALRLFSDSNFDSLEVLSAQLCDNIFDAVMAARTSFFPYPDLSRFQTDIVIDHDQFFFRIDLIIVYQGSH